MPLVNAIQSVWKNNLKHSNTNSQNLILVDHHLVKSNSLFSIEKPDSRELYCIINYSRNNKHVTNIFWKEVWFEGIRLEGHLCITTKSYHKYVSFQYKILNKILYLNEKRFWLWTFYNIILLLQQFFCDNITHLACDCIITQCLWKKLQLKLKDDLTLLQLLPHAAIFGVLEVDCQCYLMQNHILLISKLYIYNSRNNTFLSSTCLLKKISKIKNIEKKVASVNEKKNIAYKRKWGRNWRQTTLKNW